MVSYKCYRCGKIYGHKSEYTRHINRKNPCKSNNLLNNVQNEQKYTQNEQNELQNCDKKANNKCLFCNKMFTTNSSRIRHQSKFCKIKRQQDQEKEDLMAQLIKEKEQNKRFEEKLAEKDRQMEKLLIEMNSIKKLIQNQNTKNIQKATSIQNATKIQNNTMNTVNNIKIIAYGKEDLSHILETDYKMILNKGFKSVPALVESIHFNKNKPENHNIYISNMRDNYVLVYNGEEWQLMERENVLQEIVDSKTDILNDKFEELVDNLDEVTIKKFRRFLDQKDEDAVINNIKKDLRLLLYNKRKTVEGNKNLESLIDNQ